jgi:vacuolar-type H+-ATPase subunit I/STV1
MDGREFYRLVTKSVLTTASPVNVLTAAGILGLGTLTLTGLRRSGSGRSALSDRILTGYLLLFLFIGLQLLITKKAWGPHHVMMLYPFHLLVVLAAAARMAGPVGAVVAAGVLAMPSCRLGLRPALPADGGIRGAVESRHRRPGPLAGRACP